MELRHLHILKEVVERGGFSKAARALGSTQSTVSKAVAQLEHDCAVPLLDRTGAAPRLTAAGEAVYTRALVLLREQEALRADLDALRGLRRGRLSLGLPPLGSGILFAPAIAAYRRRYPDVEIRLRETGGRKVEAAVMAGDLEIGVTLPPLDSGLGWKEILREPMVALLPPGFLPGLPLDKPVRLRQLATRPFVFFEEGFAINTLLLDACRRRGFTPGEAARSGQPDFIMALVASGLGVGFLPRLVVEGRKLPVRVVPLDGSDLRWTPGLIWRKGRPLSPAAQAWIALLRETFGAPGNLRD